MKFEVTLDLLYEMAMCISDNGLDRDEACKYVKSCVMEGVTEVPVDNKLKEESDNDKVF